MLNNIVIRIGMQFVMPCEELSSFLSSFFLHEFSLRLKFIWE